MPLIELNDVSKFYEEAGTIKRVLERVRLHVETCELVVLLGRSGSGKSTMLNIISGIDVPSTGEVRLAGHSIHGLSERERTQFRRYHIGFIFQFFNLIPTLTVAENVMLPLELINRPDSRRVQQMLDAVGLGDREDSYPDRLSGGEQQRVAIARALIHEPDIVLADEPTGNLDFETGMLIIDLLDRLVRQQGKTMIMATHSREVIGLAGAQAEPFRVWVENCSLVGVPDTVFALRVRAVDSFGNIDLIVRAEKPVILQGDNGWSRKSAAMGNASYYYSYPRMRAEGSVAVGDRIFSVTGSAWLDREWSTSAMSKEQTGWDWFALQLDNGWDLMWYQLRRTDGTISRFSSGSLIDPNGHKENLTAHDVQLTVLKNWNSPNDIRYPSQWQLQIPAKKLDIHIIPRVVAQEWTGRFRYWEGAVYCRGNFGSDQVTGVGYAELTGYTAHSTE